MLISNGSSHCREWSKQALSDVGQLFTSLSLASAPAAAAPTAATAAGRATRSRGEIAQLHSWDITRIRVDRPTALRGGPALVSGAK